MPASKKQQICLAQNCGKEITKEYRGLNVCPSPSDCYYRYQAGEAERKRIESYAVKDSIKILLAANNMGKDYDSLENFVQQVE